jgi:hypothetical protein
MPSNQSLKDMRGESRRRFLKWSGAVAAAVGVDRAGYLNFLVDQGGHATADAAITKALRSVHLVCGNGVFGWFQQLWPHTEVGKAFARHYAGGSPGDRLSFFADGQTNSVVYNPALNYPATSTGADGVNHEFFYSKYAPWMTGTGADRKPKKGMAVTGIMAGKDETHTQFPTSASKISGKADLLAGVAAIQQKESTAIAPVIGTDFQYGKAPGAPDAVIVPGSAGLIGLFNSAASLGLLSIPKDQKVFETYYKAMAGLHRAAPRSSVSPHLEVSKNAARLIGQNFATQLTPTSQDLVNFGISNLSPQTTQFTTSQKLGLEEFGKMMITTARALALGLCNSTIISVSPGPTADADWTDPHNTFNGSADLTRSINTSATVGLILEGWYNYLNGIPDPENGGTLADHTVMTVHGDTPHTPLQGGGWPDATPDACNWMYVVGKGYIKTGWFGRVQVLANKAQSGCTRLFDTKTGDDYAAGAKNSSICTQAACGSVAYAVAKGDDNLVSGDLGAPKTNYAGLIAPGS